MTFLGEESFFRENNFALIQHLEALASTVGWNMGNKAYQFLQEGPSAIYYNCIPCPKTILYNVLF